MAKRRRGSFSKLWVITLLLIVSFVAGLFYLEKQTKTTHHRTHPTTIKAESKPKFDFYTVLPQTKPEVSINNITSTHIPPPNNSTSANNKYLLQVAAVKAFTDADKLKAQLILQGFDVSIQKIKIGDTVWHRVNVGPFNTLGLAQTNQANLRKLNINSILLKIRF
jgi:cell division protein FtsN